MQRNKRWSFDQLADAAEQQPRHADAEQDYRPASRIFQTARWYSALETRAGAPTLSLEKRGIPAKREALLISDWQLQCPHPRIQMKPVT
jgi:hypothetical protein